MTKELIGCSSSPSSSTHVFVIFGLALPFAALSVINTRSSPSPEFSVVGDQLAGGRAAGFLYANKFRKKECKLLSTSGYLVLGTILVGTVLVAQLEELSDCTGVIEESIVRRSTETRREDYNGDIEQAISSPSISSKCTGGWKWAFLLLANQALATLAFFGVGVNLVLFLTRVLGQDNAEAANNVSKWTGTVYLFSLIGAFLSDSYWGRYITCTVFQIILVLGLMLLSLTSWLFLIKPQGCGDGHLQCNKSSTNSELFFYFSIYMVAFGYGGHQPTIATFGADQFDESDPKHRNSKAVFFCYFYFALNVGSLFSNTVLVYYEDNGYWTIGFLAATGAAFIGLVSFVMGSPGYRYIKAHGNPLPRVAQVFVATFRKRKVAPASPESLYEVEGSESAIKGSRKIMHSNEFEHPVIDIPYSLHFTNCGSDLLMFTSFNLKKLDWIKPTFLDKAATVTDKDINMGYPNPWKLCTVTQVEEAKCVLKLLPIWLCTIIYSVIFTQMASLFVEQGDVMDTMIGNFHLPAAGMTAFDICSVLVCTGIYRQILVPLASRLSGNPKGLTELQRMGAGLVIGLLAMVAAGVTEIERLKKVIPNERKSSLSILYQIPQYVLVGTSEVFMYVGQLEFFNGQAPDGIKSFGSSLCMASISFGNYVSSLLVHMVMKFTAKGDSPGWIPADLNTGHMDRFYFLIAVITAADFVVYVFCARWYKPINFGDHREDCKEVEMIMEGEA
ncbi:NRT1/ PTR FAMILY 7.1-like protein [Drosera capensis]